MAPKRSPKLVALTVFPLPAQEVGATVAGLVSDPNGLGVPEARVQATNEATGVTTSTVTSSTGDYVVPSLAPGTYRLTIEKPGFKTSVLSNITLEVFQRARLDIRMEVGEVSARIEVQATAPLGACRK